MSDVQLKEQIADLLAKQNPEGARTFRNDSGQVGNDIRSLNQYFRVQLGKAPVDTRSERECLIDDLSPSMWLKYFESNVLGTLVRFKLPSE